MRQLAALGANPAPVMAGIAEGLLHSTQDRFDTKVGPDGIPWVPLAPSTKRMKRGPGLLVETGQMSGTIFPAWGSTFAEISAQSFYSKWHQAGTKPYKIRPKGKKALAIPGIAEGPADKSGKGPVLLRREVNHPGLPARPYIGVSDADRMMILDSVLDALDAALDA